VNIFIKNKQGRSKQSSITATTTIILGSIIMGISILSPSSAQDHRVVNVKTRKSTASTAWTTPSFLTVSDPSTCSDWVFCHRFNNTLKQNQYQSRHQQPRKTMIKRNAALEVSYNDLLYAVTMMRISRQEVSNRPPFLLKSSYASSSFGCDFSHPSCVSFDYIHLETIHEIPSQHSYSREEKQNMWTSAAEEQPMILQNTIEYEYEGWDYTQVVEEQDFALVEGRLIHPVHMWSLLMEQQQQQSQLQLL
jgi:hypothetical protein